MKQVFLGTTSALLLLAATAAGAQQAASDDGLDFLFESEPAPEVPTDSSPEIIPEADAAPAPDMGAESGAQFDDIETIPVESQEPATPQAKPKPSTAQLEEIVVTAQKRQQSLQDVPLSVTAMDGDFIKDINAADLAEVSNYVPNVRVDADDLGSPQIFIRGFGTNAFNPSFESSVALVQDEIYYGRPGYFTESLFDVERVEVLRGPQGTLFGKNSIAG
ncbi:MAG: Plug domain-containing protein, partial [Pseudomonadota bacterium]|nr:Plug domain-containing protein [Pseudomonadota bacterium]